MLQLSALAYLELLRRLSGCHYCFLDVLVCKYMYLWLSVRLSILIAAALIINVNALSHFDHASFPI